MALATDIKGVRRLNYFLLICFLLFTDDSVGAGNTPFYGVNQHDIEQSKITDPVLDAKNRFAAGDKVFLYIDLHNIQKPLRARDVSIAQDRAGLAQVEGINNRLPGLSRQQGQVVKRLYRLQGLAQGWRFAGKTEQQKLAMLRQLTLYANRFNLTMWRSIYKKK